MPSPIIIHDASSPPSVLGSSLQQYRRGLCETLDEFGVLRVSDAAAAGETHRWVICEGVQSDGLPEGRLDGMWLYVVDGTEAGACRRVLEGSYIGNVGAFLVDRAFSSVLAPGTEIELSRSLPAERYGTVTGARNVINSALGLLPVVDRARRTADGTRRMPMTDTSWPIMGVEGVYHEPGTADAPLRSLGMRFQFNHDAESPYLQFAGAPAAGAELIVDLLRPASTRIAVAGVWGDSSVGLVNESDRALYSVQMVVSAARPIALRRLSLSLPRGSAERNDIEAEAARADLTAGVSKWFGRFRMGTVQRVGAV